MSNRARTTTSTTSRKIPFQGAILRVHAFWQANLPGGLDLGIEFDHDTSAGEEFAHWIEGELASFDTHATVPMVVTKLGNIATFQERDEVMATTALASIYWLEERGHLVPDEHNGLSWAWIPRGTRDLAHSEQNPVLLDMSTILAIDVTTLATTPGAHAALAAVTHYARTEPNPTTDWTYSHALNRAQRRAQRSRRT